MSTVALRKRDSAENLDDLGVLASTTLTYTLDQTVPPAINATPTFVLPDWTLAAKTTIPTLIVTDFILGSTPTSGKLQSLADFSLAQYNAYAAAGVGDPSIGPYEALGLGLSGTAEFIAKFGSGSDTSFIRATYREAFDRDPNDTQIAHFQSQLAYFRDLYLGAGVDPNAATLGARGAVVGQILGFAAAEAGNAYSDAAQMLLLDTANGGTVRPVNLITEYGLNDSGPSETVTVTNNVTTFLATTSTIDFRIDGALFSGISTDFLVTVNGVRVTSPISFSTDKSHFLISNLLQSGENDILVFGIDDQGNPIKYETVIWAGSNALTVRVVDKNGQPIIGASLVAKLTEANEIFEKGTSDQNGLVTFTNLPNRNITIEGEQGTLFGAIGALGGQSLTTVVLLPLDPPSQIANDDFSLGFDGWDVGSAPVTLEDHQEGAAASFNPLLDGPEPRAATSSNYSVTSNAPSAVAAVTLNKDMVLSTHGEGPQTIHRGFVVKPGAEVVTLRYKFVTSEIPGGYFGSDFNDYYTITIRDSFGHRISITESMNGLGLSAFDANGATAWRELKLAVPTSAGVQIDVTVANVGDDQYDSKLILDFVGQGKLWIKSFDLNDIDNSDLAFLSVSGTNPFFTGHTRINGTISIMGDATDKLSSITLEIIQGGRVVAHADLSDSARLALLNQEFGSDNEISIKNSNLFFELSNAQAALISTKTDGFLDLRVKVTTGSGQEVYADYGSVGILTLFQGGNRYPQSSTDPLSVRDPTQGGDGWGVPSTIELIKHYSTQYSSMGFLVGDISNMNGGPFAPHSEHRGGQDFDGWYLGYNAHDSFAAAAMLYLLNDHGYGSHIGRVLVAYTRTADDPFWNTIKDITLYDGRRADAVIIPDANHTTHFHWDLWDI